MPFLTSPSFITSGVPDLYNSLYECPSIFNTDGSLKHEPILHSELITWLHAAVAEGTEFLKHCRAYKSVYNAIDIICKDIELQSGSNISDVYANNIKRYIKEIIAILSNIRPSWVYEAHSSRDPQWLESARVQNGLSEDWYKNNDVDLALKKLLELGTVEGTGYISPIWNPHLYGWNQGGIELKHYRYNEVLPVQIGRDFDLQRAYAVVLKDEMPINRAKKIFPHKRHLLIADRGETNMADKSTYAKVKASVKGFFESIAEADGQKKKTYPSPVVDILHCYVDDFSVNPTNHEIQMGEASWGYTVPYVGQDIPNGYNKDGSIKYKKATFEDCMLYPYRRLIIASKTCILYDGPSFWLHRKVPVVKYSPDEWIFSYLGFSLAAEVSTLDRASNKMRRDIEDALHLKIDPPLAVDEIGMSKTQAEKNSTLRKPGNRIRGKLQMGDFIKSILPPESYNIGSEHFAFVEKTEEKMKELLGLPDLKALQQARQIPSSDTVSQFFSQAGAIVTAMSRSLDPVMKFIADCNRYYFFQFYDVEKRIKILGADGVTKEDFDFDPGTLVPSHFPYEQPTTKGIYESNRIDRTRWYLTNFRTTIEPTSLHQITHMQRKLLLMQATKLIPGYPMIDPETLAKELDIPNWGRFEGDTIQQKVQSFMVFMEKFGLKTQYDQAMLQLAIQQQIMAASPQGQLMNIVQGLGDEIANNGKSLGLKRGEGRPPEFKEAPELENKGDRTTIST